MKNPFKLVLPYVLGSASVIYAVYSYYSMNINQVIFLFDKITIGNLYKIIPLNIGNIGIINPLAMLNLFVYGFILGWGLELIIKFIFKKLWRKKVRN